MCPQRACTRPTFGSEKNWTVRWRKSRRRDEVGVEDRDVLALGDLQPRFERARLVAGAIRAVDIRDVDPLRGIAAHGALGDARRFIRRVVEDLDLEQLARVVDPADGVDETVRHVHLVVDRKLDRDGRQLLERAERNRLPILVLHVQVDQVVPVPPVNGENDEDEEIRRECQRLGGGHARIDIERAPGQRTDAVIRQRRARDQHRQ